jgi:hypothetical protein
MVPTQPVGMNRFEKISFRSPLVDLVPLKPTTPTAIMMKAVNASVA